ncbi:MAG: hypothetical protein V4722_22320 [Bacteroidota bacterium]
MRNRIALIKILFLCVCNLLPFSFLYAQEQRQDSLAIIDKGELNRLFNNLFGKIVTSNSNTGLVGNYASLDVANASFEAKSTIPISKKGKKVKGRTFEEGLNIDTSRISYLSILVKGGLTDKNYGAVFSNSSLNAGFELGAQYNFKLKRPKVRFFADELQNFYFRKTMLLQAYSAKKLNALQNQSKSFLTKYQYLLQLKKVSNADTIRKKQYQIDLLSKSVDSLGAGILDRAGMADTLQNLMKESIALRAEEQIIIAAIDSIKNLTAIAGSITVLDLAKLRETTKSDYDKLFSDISFVKFSLLWFTASANYSRKAFNTFNVNVPFDAQVGKDEFNGHSFGFAVNLLRQDSLKLRTWFFNAGISLNRKNNLASLSTTTIKQTKTVVNATGDSVREISDTYEAYTAAIEKYNTFNVSAHAYYIFGKTPSGFHLFPSIDFRANRKAICDFTCGYLVSFQNTVKDQPLFNTEIYLRLNDLFNSNNTDDRYYNRNEIGISFTIPFRFLF